jgi:hypothetical protein
MNEEKEVVIELEPVTRTERWFLWQVEDRVAQRWSPVFCAPSMAVIEKQFKELKEKQKSVEGELYKRVIAVLDGEKLMEVMENEER